MRRGYQAGFHNMYVDDAGPSITQPLYYLSDDHHMASNTFLRATPSLSWSISARNSTLDSEGFYGAS